MKTEEQLLRSKVKYLEDRVKVLDKAVGRINQILGRFQMTEATGFEDLEDIKDHVSKVKIVGDHELI